jgi:2',3'-cyclic-nucleotide 2'-phosphodiesterase (5'-nucleotidase family)
LILQVNFMDVGNVRNGLIPVSLPSGKPLSGEESPAAQGDTVSIGNAGGNTVRLDILHMNDVHGQVSPKMAPKITPDGPVGGLAHVKTVVDRERAKNPEGTLTLNAGDIAEGTMESYLTQGKAVAAAFNSIGFDAIELGNHDFSWGQDALKCIVEGLDAPVLAANVVKTSDGSTLDGVKPYIVKDLKGVRVGIIGLDTTTTPRYVDESKLEGIRFEDAAATLKKQMPRMKEEGADLILVLSHLGFEDDKKLAADVPGIDLIVGGHSHTELPGGHREGDTMIVQAGSQGEYVGKLQIDVDPGSKKIVSHKAGLIPVIAGEIEPDAGVMGILKPYLDEVNAIGAKVMGTALEDLSFSHKEPGKLNQIFADSCLDASGADIGICSSRKLRGGIKQGDVPYRALFSAVPFSEEEVVMMKVKGGAVLAEIEERLKDGGRGVIVPSGFKYEYDPSLPNGSRVTSTTLPDGSFLDPEKEYSVVLDDGIARKERFKDGSEFQSLGGCQKMFFDYFQGSGPWKNDPDDRIRQAG